MPESLFCIESTGLLAAETKPVPSPTKAAARAAISSDPPPTPNLSCSTAAQTHRRSCQCSNGKSRTCGIGLRLTSRNATGQHAQSDEHILQRLDPDVLNLCRSLLLEENVYGIMTVELSFGALALQLFVISRPLHSPRRDLMFPFC